METVAALACVAHLWLNHAETSGLYFALKELIGYIVLAPIAGLGTYLGTSETDSFFSGAAFALSGDAFIGLCKQIGARSTLEALSVRLKTLTLDA